MMVFIFKSLLPGSFRSLMPAQRAESKSDTTGLKIFWQIIQEISGWMHRIREFSAIRWRRVNCSAIFPVPVRIKARTFRSLSV
jgi:Two component regulator propeller